MSNPFEENKLHCCMIGCLPTRQKPLNILRTVPMFDLFVASFTAVLILSEIREEYKNIPKLLALITSGVNYIHSLMIVMFYRILYSENKLLQILSNYSIFRM